MFGRLLLTAILALGCAAAQDDISGGGMTGGRGGSRGGGMGGDMGGSGMPQPRRMNPLEQIAEKLKMNKEQKASFAEIMTAAAKDAAPVRAEMDKARADLAGGMIDGKSPEEVTKLTAAYASAAAKMTKVEADAFAKILATLKPNQQSKADQAFELLSTLFTGPGRMGGGGGAGRGRGRGEGR